MASNDPLNFRSYMRKQKKISRSSFSKSQSRFQPVPEQDVLNHSEDVNGICSSSGYGLFQRAESAPVLSSKDSLKVSCCKSPVNIILPASFSSSMRNVFDSPKTCKKDGNLRDCFSKQGSVSSLPNLPKRSSSRTWTAPEISNDAMSDSQLRKLLAKQTSFGSCAPSVATVKDNSHLRNFLVKQASVGSFALPSATFHQKGNNSSGSFDFSYQEANAKASLGGGSSNNFYQVRALWAARSQRSLSAKPEEDLRLGSRWKRPQNPKPHKKSLREYMTRELSTPVLPFRRYEARAVLDKPTSRPTFFRRASTGMVRFDGEPEVSYYWTPNRDETFPLNSLGKKEKATSSNRPPRTPRRRSSTGSVIVSDDSTKSHKQEGSRPKSRHHPRLRRRASTGTVKFGDEPEVTFYWNPKRGTARSIPPVISEIQIVSKAATPSRKVYRRQSTGSITSSDELTLMCVRVQKREGQKRRNMRRSRMVRRASTGSMCFFGEPNVSFYWKPNRDESKLPLQLLNKVDNQVPPQPNPPVRPRRRGSTGGVRFAEEPTICYFSRAEGELSHDVIRSKGKKDKKKKGSSLHLSSKWNAESEKEHCNNTPLRRVVRRKSSGSISLPSEPESRLDRKERRKRESKGTSNRRRHEKKARNKEEKTCLLDAVDPITEMIFPPPWSPQSEPPKNNPKSTTVQDRKSTKNVSERKGRTKTPSCSKSQTGESKSGQPTTKPKSRKTARVEFIVTDPGRSVRSHTFDAFSGSDKDSETYSNSLDACSPTPKKKHSSKTKSAIRMTPLCRPVKPPTSRCPNPTLDKLRSQKQVIYQKVEFIITDPVRKMPSATETRT